MALTKGEIVQVAGRLVTKIGQAIDDEQTPNQITKDEVFQIVQDGLGDLLKEYSD